MKIKPRSKLIMIGDSITDCGRSRKEKLGNGYVNLIDGQLKFAHVEQGIQVVNKGVSGNTVRDLKKRWKHDVLDLKPDWLSVMIGINDVWQQMDNWMPLEECVSIKEYDHTLDEIISTVSLSLSGLVLMTPYVLESNLSDPMRVMMDDYGAVAQNIAKKYKAIFIDTQALFDEILRDRDVAELSGDRVHLNIDGHTILAHAFLEAII